MSRSYRTFRIKNADNIINSMSNYFFFLGYDGNTGGDVNAIATEKTARHASSFAQKILVDDSSENTDVSRVIRRYDWSSGDSYDPYDPEVDQSNKKYYVKNSQDNVYICIKNNTSGEIESNIVSTVEPTGRVASPVLLSDGYTWKYLYTIDRGLQKFMRSVNGVSYMPVKSLNTRQGLKSANGTSGRSQYMSEVKTLPGSLVSARIDLSSSILFDDNTTTIKLLGNGDKEAKVNFIYSFTEGGSYAVTGMEVTDGGKGHTTLTPKLVGKEPNNMTAETAENAIKLALSPITSGQEIKQKATSWFDVDTIMIVVELDKKAVQDKVSGETYNIFGISKDYLLNKTSKVFAGTETTAPRPRYRLGQKIILRKTSSWSFDELSSGDVLYYGTDNRISGQVTNFTDAAPLLTGIGSGTYANVELNKVTGPSGGEPGQQGWINVSHSAGAANGVGVSFGSGGAYGVSQTTPAQSDLAFTDSDIFPTSGDVLYITRLDTNLNLSNEQFSTFVFLQTL